MGKNGVFLFLFFGLSAFAHQPTFDLGYQNDVEIEGRAYEMYVSTNGDYVFINKDAARLNGRQLYQKARAILAGREAIKQVMPEKFQHAVSSQQDAKKHGHQKDNDPTKPEQTRVPTKEFGRKVPLSDRIILFGQERGGTIRRPGSIGPNLFYDNQGNQYEVLARKSNGTKDEFVLDLHHYW